MNLQALDTTNLLHVKNIVYATDLSFASERALPYAHEIARRYKAAIYVVHAIHPDIYPMVPPAAWSKMAEDEEVFRQESKADLDENLRDVRHELIFRKGDVARVLNDVIKEKDSDLLVMSTRGRNHIQEVLLGSIAEKMFRHVECPVLTVGPSVVAKPRNAGELNLILYATNFGTESLAAAPFAISLAREHRARLILLHCSGHDHSGDSAMRHNLADLIPFGVELREQPDCIVEHGQPSGKILEIAEGHGVDLIVLGIHSTKDRKVETERFLHPGVLKIVTEANCPVLTTRR